MATSKPTSPGGAPALAGAAALAGALLACAYASAIGPAWADAAPAAEVSSTVLIEHPREWEGRVVALTGETIGERMRRGDMAWLHINDDTYAQRNIEEGAELGGYNSGHAVWLPATLAAEVTHFGDYKHKGDTVRVEGTFNRACALHGGDMDIHATALEVLERGHPVPHRFNTGRAVVASVLLILAAAMYALRVRARRKRI